MSLFINNLLINLESLPEDVGAGGQSWGHGFKGQGQRAPPAIHTVKEEPDMPDSQVIVSIRIKIINVYTVCMNPTPPGLLVLCHHFSIHLSPCTQTPTT